MKLSLFSLMSFALSASLVAADVAGTTTLVISLATGDNGEIIPVIMHKNSAGYEPILLSSTSADAVDNGENSAESIGSQEPEASADAESSQTIAESALESPFPVENPQDTTAPQEPEQQSSSAEDSASDAVVSEDSAVSQETAPANNGDSDSESDSDNEAGSPSSESAEAVKKSSAQAIVPSMVLLALSTWFISV